MNKKAFKTVIGAVAVALASGTAWGESASDIGTLPSQKVPAAVDQGDRNPFATRIDGGEDDIFGIVDAESEESKIRQVFANLKVNGRVPASDGTARVLVGDLILKEGHYVPQVIENQTDKLRVSRITEEEVEIMWVDEEQAEAPRKVLIPVNLEPEVSFILPGRNPQSGGQFVTYEKKDQEEEDAEDEDQPDEDEIEAEAGSKKPEAEEPKKVSPFGLFRR